MNAQTVISPDMYASSPTTSPLINHLPTIPVASNRSTQSNISAKTNLGPITVSPGTHSNITPEPSNHVAKTDNSTYEITVSSPTHEQLVEAYQKMERRKQQQHEYYVKRKQEREYLQNKVQQLEAIIQQQNELLRQAGYQPVSRA